MKYFTIDADNNITCHANRQAARDTGAGVFSTEVQLADLIGPDNKRLLEIWNSLPGVKSVTKFANRKAATERIWKVIQSLGETPATKSEAVEAPAELAPEAIKAAVPAEFQSEPAAEPASDPEQPIVSAEPAAETPVEPADTEQTVSPVPAEENIATVGAQVADVAPTTPAATKKVTAAKSTPKAQKAAKAQESAGPREGSKTAQVVAMLQRKNGATLTEIMEKMGWLKHTVRGFMAGAMKKAGFTVESFKPKGGERTYRINQ
jgi:hypothetical protein